jgi:hypothetical protein
MIGWNSTDPSARELNELQKKAEQTKDPGLIAEFQDKLLDKMAETTHLLSTIAVAKAVYLHGLAGDIARDFYGEESMIASDIIHCLGEAFSVCEQESHSKFQYIQR